MKQKILIIDDNDQIVTLVESILKKEYDVYSFTHALMAIEFLEDKKNPIDLIICDVMMPDISGHEFCSQIKANEELKHIPLIFMSAKTGVRARVTGHNLGAINYIEKPFEIMELRAIIHSTLQNFATSKVGHLNLGELKLIPENQEVIVKEKPLKLTRSEYKILYTLLLHPGQIYERDQLLEKIGHTDKDNFDRSIDNHISSLRKKLKNSGVEIITIYGSGYKLLTSD